MPHGPRHFYEMQRYKSTINEVIEHILFSNPYDHKAGGGELAPWPVRLTSPPPRLADFGYSNDMFEKDMEMWGRRVENYWNLLTPKIQSDTLRNVMDMKAHLGSFAAALKDKDVWVMNVVLEDGPNTLKVVYDRGLIGAAHNWLRFQAAQQVCMAGLYVVLHTLVFWLGLVVLVIGENIANVSETPLSCAASALCSFRGIMILLILTMYRTVDSNLADCIDDVSHHLCQTSSSNLSNNVDNCSDDSNSEIFRVKRQSALKVERKSVIGEIKSDYAKHQGLKRLKKFQPERRFGEMVPGNHSEYNRKSDVHLKDGKVIGLRDIPHKGSIVPVSIKVKRAAGEGPSIRH